MASPAAVVTAAPTAQVIAATFTSETYGYTLTLPAGWTSMQASTSWDGKTGLSSDSPEVDRFFKPGLASSSGVAAPTGKKLAAYIDELIVATATFHGNTCPPKPATQDPITIGGEPGVLIAWDCGILINNALTIRDGIGYQFLLRDPAIHGATDPTDRALFVAMLESVQFPE